MIKTEALNFKETYTSKANFISEIGSYLNENYENIYTSYKNASDYILTRVYFYYYNYYLNAGTKEDFERLFTFTLTSKLDYFNALLNVYNSSINPREKEKIINNSSDSVVHTSKGEQTNASSPENYNDFDTDSYITNKNKHNNKTTDNINHDFTSSILQSLGMTLKDIALIPMKLNEEIVKTFAKLFIGESGEEKSYPLIYQNLTNVYYKLLDYVKKLPDSEELQREIEVINSSLSGITDSLNDIDNRLNTNETNISSLETSICNIKSNLDLTNTNLSSLEIKLKEEVTRALSKEETIVTDIKTIRNEIETITTNLENVEKALSNYATLSYLNEEYYNKATIDNFISSLNTSISEVSTKVDTNTSKITEVEETSTNALTLAQTTSTSLASNYYTKSEVDDKTFSSGEVKLYKHKITISGPFGTGDTSTTYDEYSKRTFTTILPTNRTIKDFTNFTLYCYGRVGFRSSYSGYSFFDRIITLYFISATSCVASTMGENSYPVIHRTFSFSSTNYYTYEIEEVETE